MKVVTNTNELKRDFDDLKKAFKSLMDAAGDIEAEINRLEDHVDNAIADVDDAEVHECES